MCGPGGSGGRPGGWPWPGRSGFGILPPTKGLPKDNPKSVCAEAKRSGPPRVARIFSVASRSDTENAVSGISTAASIRPFTRPSRPSAGASDVRAPFAPGTRKSAAGCGCQKKSRDSPAAGSKKSAAESRFTACLILRRALEFEPPASCSDAGYSSKEESNRLLPSERRLDLGGRTRDPLRAVCLSAKSKQNWPPLASCA